MNIKTSTNQSLAKRAVMVLVVLFTALTAGATKFITDVGLIGIQGESNINSLIKNAQNNGWTLVNKDLNAGCGPESDYIYLLYQWEENTDGFNHGYITDFFIVGSRSSSVEKELTYQGRTYHLVDCTGGQKFIESDGDLNRAASGDYIHLYYTKDPMDGKAVSNITFNTTRTGAVGNQGGDTGYDLNSGCGPDTDYIYMHLTKNKISTVTLIDRTYDSPTGLTSEIKYCTKFDFVSSNDTEWDENNYVVSGNVELSNRINVKGRASLILLDGSTLTANQGIEVEEGNTLNIFAQSEGANGGKLKAYATKENYSGIGGGINGKDCGVVFILSGTVEAKGGKNGAGIGGGNGGDGGSVNILGGSVEAKGGENGAGIGGGNGGSCVKVNVCSGTVKANGGEFAAGIGGGNQGDGGEFAIYGGTVEAQGGINGAGIGAGKEGSGDNVFLNKGLVKAYGGINAYGFGQAYGGKSSGSLDMVSGIKIYGGYSENPTRLISDSQSGSISLYRYMIAGGNIRGDANDDYKVNIADLVEMVNAKKNNASDRFVLKNADIDGNEVITQEDIDEVVKIIVPTTE